MGEPEQGKALQVGEIPTYLAVGSEAAATHHLLEVLLWNSVGSATPSRALQAGTMLRLSCVQAVSLTRARATIRHLAFRSLSFSTSVVASAVSAGVASAISAAVSSAVFSGVASGVSLNLNISLGVSLTRA